MNFKELIKKYQLTELAEDYANISEKVLSSIPHDQWIWMLEEYGDGENCKTRAFEFFLKDHNHRNKYSYLFDDLYQKIFSIPDCVHAYVTYVEPKSSIPQHTDEFDGFRIVTAVNYLPECWLTIDDHHVVFEKGKSVGFQANLISHGGENPSDDHWVFLVFDLYPNPFDSLVHI